MTPEQILSLVQQPADARLRYGQAMFELITTYGLANGLELKPSPGIATVYLAGALEAAGGGHLTSICQRAPRRKDYNVEAALRQTGLTSFVSLGGDSHSYNWSLMQLLQEGLFEYFDFCVIDRGRTWSEVGFAACLAERLLKPGGWVVLDNLRFTFRESRFRKRPWVQDMPEDEQITPQIRRVFDLLLRESPYFETFRTRGSMAFARKREAIWSSQLRSRNKIESVVCDLIERARYDPEFREELLSAPRIELSHLPGTKSYGPQMAEVQMGETRRDGQAAIRFEDTDRILPAAAQEDSGGLVVYLGKPAWEKATGEDALNKMLAE